MALPKPSAMWPLQIQAGVNDSIDFSIAGGAHAATIAPATYYSPATLAEAVRVALDAAYSAGVVIVAGVNDHLGLLGGYTSAGILAAGSYTRASLPGAVVAALEAVEPTPTWSAILGSPYPTDRLHVAVAGGDPTWNPQLGGPSAWGTLGFTSTRASGSSQTGDDPIVFPVAAWSVSVSTEGRVTVFAAVAFSLKFSTGAHAATSARDVLGFGTVDTASATSATGGVQIPSCWFASYPVVDDTGELPSHERAQAVSLGGVAKSLHFGTRQTRTVSLAFIPAYKWRKADEGSHTNEAIERLIESGWARFRWFSDSTDLATGTDYALDLESAKGLPRNRLAPGTALYSLALKMRPIV